GAWMAPAALGAKQMRLAVANPHGFPLVLLAVQLAIGPGHVRHGNVLVSIETLAAFVALLGACALVVFLSLDVPLVPAIRAFSPPGVVIRGCNPLAHGLLQYGLSVALAARRRPASSSHSTQRVQPGTAWRRPGGIGSSQSAQCVRLVPR